MSKGGLKSLILDITKIRKLSESFSFWITFLLLKYVKSLIIRYLKNRFGKLCILWFSKTINFLKIKGLICCVAYLAHCCAFVRLVLFASVIECRTYGRTKFGVFRYVESHAIQLLHGRVNLAAHG